MSFNGWNYISGRDYCIKVADGTHDSPKRKDSGRYLITSKHIKGRSIDFENAYLISEDDYNKINQRSKVDQWDVLISMIGEYCGFCYVERESIINYAVKNVGIFKTGSKVKSEWLYYYLNSPEGKNTLKSYRSGTSQPYLSLGSLRKFPILVSENQREMENIVQILSTLDEKIEVNNQINKTLEAMAQTIFKQWFVDFEFPNGDGKPYKSSGGEMVKSELGMIPKRWEVKKLGDFIRFIKGKKSKMIDEKRFDGSKVYLTIDVLNRNSILYCNTERMIEVNKYNTLMVMDGASSGTLFYGQDGIVASTLAKIEVTNKTLSDEFIYYVLKSYEDGIKTHTTGSAIPHADKEYINKLVIAIPSNLKIIELFNDNISQIREKIINNEEESLQLKKIRDALLPKLMSGEIRVPLEQGAEI